MIEKKCVHPIKVNRFINEFVNTVCELPEDTYFVIKSSTTNDMNFFVCGEIGEDEELEIIVPRWRTANYKGDIGGKLFRKDFVSKCAMAKGFSDVTISLLHEVGHKMTDKDIPTDYRRSTALREISENCSDPYEVCARYFSLIDESLATNWAINWLSDPENRKIAKDFEKKFFSCFTALAR